MDYPIKIKTSRAFIQELYSAEEGRYDDALNARKRNDVEAIKNNDYDVVACDFILRWKTQIEVRDDRELRELYYACASGMIGLYGYTREANRILNKIRSRVKEIDPGLVDLFPYQTGL
jgi:hypothetical protein